MSINPTITYEEFSEWVREALNQLYDSTYLQTHPLVDVLVGRHTNGIHRSQALRRILLDAINDLRPDPSIPARSPDWRAYRILELRYVEGLSAAETMHTLALGRSQFYRDQSQVLDLLISNLWEQKLPAAAEDALQTGLHEQFPTAELERLQRQATWETLDVTQILQHLKPVLSLLADSKGVTITYQLRHEIIASRLDRIMLRQAVLNVLMFAIKQTTSYQVIVSTLANQNQIGISVTAPVDDPEMFSSTISENLLNAMQGELIVTTEPHWQVQLVWPASLTMTPILLVIDDNVTCTELYNRYLAGFNWQIIGAASGAAARHILGTIQPSIIMLDLMMPDEDGWELLMSFRADPQTRDIPIIICSVLKNGDAALALGAADYLSKPVTQDDLLRTLSKWHSAHAIPD
jgi:CheY-like chemotaxis protein